MIILLASFDSNHTDRSIGSRPCQAPRLTETSYIVLGLLEQVEPATPYDLKQLAAAQHDQLLDRARTRSSTRSARGSPRRGCSTRRREETGRRRRIYRLTGDGRARARALARRSRPASSTNCATSATLKLFFGADPATLAAEQLAAHSGRLAEYEELLRRGCERRRREGWRLALELRASATSASSSASGGARGWRGAEPAARR